MHYWDGSNAARARSRFVLLPLHRICLIAWVAPKPARLHQRSVSVELHLVTTDQAGRLGDALELDELDRHRPTARAVARDTRDRVRRLPEQFLDLTLREARRVER